jgi:DNA repair protein RAD5
MVVEVLILADMICFQSCTVVHCEDRLRLGSHVILSVKVYIKPSAFRRSDRVHGDDDVRNMWNEGQQTETEKLLRDRMASLLDMFKVLDLLPRRMSPLKEMKSQQNVSIDSSMRQLSVQPGRGDGPEDEEELDDGELDLIYQK